MSGLQVTKETLMVRNLQLLGFGNDTFGRDKTSMAGGGLSAAPKLIPYVSMFDRPNEKMLFHVVFFLLGKIAPEKQQEFRFCWPIVTPQDKSNFKRVVQSMLQELERQGSLPVGSSQASRINTGCGPRLIDLIWRLSSMALRIVMQRDFSSSSTSKRTKHRKELSPFEEKRQQNPAEALLAIKSKIAMKTHQFKRKCLANSLVQDEWVASAAKLTRAIEETNRLQRKVQQEQVEHDANVNRVIYSQTGCLDRTSKLSQLESNWKVIDQVLQSVQFQTNRAVLETTDKIARDQPVLDASSLQMAEDSDSATGKRRIVLTELVRHAEAVLRACYHRMDRQNLEKFSKAHDAQQLAAVVKTSSNHIAMLSNLVQNLQQLLGKIRDQNEQESREFYIQIAAKSMQDQSNGLESIPLCPPTPALVDLQATETTNLTSPSSKSQTEEEQKELVSSLQKISMNELSGIAADSVRKSVWGKRPHQRDWPKKGEDGTSPMHQGDDDPVFRRLSYDDEEVEDMEI